MDAPPMTVGFKAVMTGVILLSAGFILGTVYANWSYDYYMLWVSPTSQDMVAAAAKHYAIKASQPAFLHHVLHGVMGMGILAITAKLYRRTESNTLFDGGSLVLFVCAIVFYITNLRPAAHSVVTGDWNDIDEETGVKLISATQVLIVFVIMGVISLQAGQCWAEHDTAKMVAAFHAEQKLKAEAEAEAGAEAGAETVEGNETVETEKASASGSADRKANKRKNK